MIKPRVLHVALAWAASLMVHGGVAATLLQYYTPAQKQPNLPVMELVQLPVLVTPPAAEPEPLPPVQPPPKKTPPPVRRPKPAEIAERVEPEPAPETAEPAAPPGPAPVMQAMAEPTSSIQEPEPVPDLSVALLENPKPAYPAIAKRRGWEGTVVLRFDLDEYGIPHELRVERSSGFDVLDHAALAYVNNWKFRPAHRNGEAIATPNVKFPISFTLQKN